MAIGILALTVGAVFSVIGIAGIGSENPPAQAEKPVRYPFPEEI